MRYLHSVAPLLAAGLGFASSAWASQQGQAAPAENMEGLMRGMMLGTLVLMVAGVGLFVTAVVWLLRTPPTGGTTPPASGDRVAGASAARRP
ncbi:MAG: hypothetical protein HY703_00685 [Gemmatimonadetes bacterium]|nr:hypothetical protein [Gemmatimonadota bacterium]